MRHVYRVTEVVGASSDGLEAAIEAATERASETLRKMEWFEVTSIRGALNGGRITDYQVTLKVGIPPRVEPRRDRPHGLRPGARPGLNTGGTLPPQLAWVACDRLT